MKRLTLPALCGLLTACASAPHTQAVPEPKSTLPSAAELSRRAAQFAPTELSADISKLPDSEREALTKIIQAARLLEPIYDRQAWAKNPALREKLAQTPGPLAAAQLRYFDIMRGPWDRQRHFEPFAVEQAHPPGAGFYPEGLSAEAFKAALKAHPERAEALQSLTTVVREGPDGLIAVPYREVYKEWLEPAAALLQEAAALTQNESLKTFLKLRAEAFLSDDYYPSDKAWMDLDSPVEVTIGPYEVYEDELMGLKASYEAYVTISDPAASAQLDKFKGLLPDMEKNLPIPEAIKTVRGAASPIRVVDLVFTAGEANKSVQTIAFNLPNDERVRAEKGAKKVMMQNIIEAKFDRILRPIAGRILDAGQQDKLSAKAFFFETLFHELSHSLGPAYVREAPKPVEEPGSCKIEAPCEPVEVRIALGSSYAAIEEAKADVMGAYNVLYMIERGEFSKEFEDKLLVSYFIGLFRSVRFGVAEAHGQGAALQINRFLSEGAARFEEGSGRFTVDPAKLRASVTALVRDICLLQAAGDKAGVDALLKEYGKMSPPIAAALSSVEAVPIDLRPSYPVAEALSP